MTRKLELPNADHWIDRYLAGESVNKLCRAAGVGKRGFTAFLRRNGAQVRSNSKAGMMAESQRVHNWIARYLAGESVNSLCRAAGVGRAEFTAFLRRNGVPLRTQSEAEFVKWERMTEIQRSMQVSAAHDAARGREIDFAEKCRRALGVEAAGRVSEIERKLGDMIAGTELSVFFQKAVGPYNLDIALDEFSVAVEVFGGYWHGYGHHRIRHDERCKYILNQGWHIVTVWIDNRRYPLRVAAAEYVVGFANLISRNPPAPRQYRVIRGDGQLAPAADRYLNSRSVVEALGCCYDPTGSHYYIAG